MSDYVKKVFEINDEVTHDDLNHMQTQYDKSKDRIQEHENKNSEAHGVPYGKRIAMTANESGFTDWEEIESKPQIPTNQDIINLENSISSLEQDIFSLDSRVSSLEQQGTEGITEQQAEDIAAGVKADNQYAAVIRVNPATPMAGEIYWVD